MTNAIPNVMIRFIYPSCIPPVFSCQSDRFVFGTAILPLIELISNNQDTVFHKKNNPI